jgi:hypothetical protein
VNEIATRLGRVVAGVRPGVRTWLNSRKAGAAERSPSVAGNPIAAPPSMADIGEVWRSASAGAAKYPQSQRAGFAPWRLAMDVSSPNWSRARSPAVRGRFFQFKLARWLAGPPGRRWSRSAVGCAPQLI